MHLVLRLANWYGRVTEREAVTHVRAPDRRCLVEADRAPVAEASRRRSKAMGWPRLPIAQR